MSHQIHNTDSQFCDVSVFGNSDNVWNGHSFKTSFVNVMRKQMLQGGGMPKATDYLDLLLRSSALRSNSSDIHGPKVTFPDMDQISNNSQSVKLRNLFSNTMRWSLSVCLILFLNLPNKTDLFTGDDTGTGTDPKSVPNLFEVFCHVVGYLRLNSTLSLLKVQGYFRVAFGIPTYQTLDRLAALSPTSESFSPLGDNKLKCMKKLSKDEFHALVVGCKSKAELLHALELGCTGSDYRKLDRMLELAKCDISHYQSLAKGKRVRKVGKFMVKDDFRVDVLIKSILDADGEPKCVNCFHVGNEGTAKRAFALHPDDVGKLICFNCLYELG